MKIEKRVLSEEEGDWRDWEKREKIRVVSGGGSG
jgi:hypothetical protein